VSYKQDKREYQQALKTYNHQCAMCGKSQVELHHIIYKSHGGKNVKENLIPLCKHHHMMVHTNEHYYVEFLLDKNRLHYGCIDKKDLIKRNKWQVAFEEV
jgi:5-methylcytosine-specific restriction endonuclease McrA